MRVAYVLGDAGKRTRCRIPRQQWRVRPALLNVFQDYSRFKNLYGTVDQDGHLDPRVRSLERTTGATGAEFMRNFGRERHILLSQSDFHLLHVG